MKKPILLYLLMIISIAVLAALTNVPWNFFSHINFPTKLHIIIESLNSILMFLIFLLSNHLYSKTKNERLLFLAGGFLVGMALNCPHIFTITAFPYDLLSVSNIEKNPDLVYLLMSILILPLSIYMSLIYRPSQVSNTNNLRLKIYTIYFCIFLVLVIAPPLFNYFFPNLTHTFNIIIQSLAFINYSLYIILASILLNIKYSYKQSFFPIFTVGLLIIGFGGLFYINPFLIPIDAILAHGSQALGLLFILLGLPRFQILSALLRFKDELLVYLSLLLITFYAVFIAVGSGLFHIIFPPYSAYVFVEFLLFFHLIIYILSTVSWNQVSKVYVTAKRDRSLIRVFESMRRVSNPNIIKNTIIEEINGDFLADECFIALYDSTNNSFYFDRYLDKLPSKTLVNFDDLDEDVLKFDEFYKIYQQNIKMCFVNAEEYIMQNSLKGTPQEKILKDYGIKSYYSVPINYANQLLGYLILQYKKEYKELTKEDLSYLKEMAAQIGIAIHQADNRP